MDHMSEIWPVCPDTFQAPGEAQTHCRHSRQKNLSTEHCIKIYHSYAFTPFISPFLSHNFCSVAAWKHASYCISLCIVYMTLCRGPPFTVRWPKFFTLSNPTHFYFFAIHPQQYVTSLFLTLSQYALTTDRQLAWLQNTKR